MVKRKILLITSRFPFPPLGGDKLKTYFLIQLLSSRYDVHLVSLIDRPITSEDRLFCKQYCYMYTLFYKSKYHSFIRALKSLYNGKPIQVNYYYFSDVAAYIDSIADQYDCVINTLIRTSEYVLNLNNYKLFDMVDSVALNYQRSKNKATSLFWRLLYKFESKKVEMYEKMCIERYNYTFCVNKNEALTLTRYGNVEWIPNGVNPKLLTYLSGVQSHKKCIAFFGKMDYQPNIDAVKWFIEKVFRYLDSDITFLIVGVYPASEISSLANERIIVTGYIEDPYRILSECRAIVAPMQTGGGIQNKILEMMALKKIIVTTFLGAEPIVGAKDKEHLLICETALQMAKQLNDICNFPEHFSAIGQNARELIAHFYTWENYGAKLFKLIDSISPEHNSGFQ